MDLSIPKTCNVCNQSKALSFFGTYKSAKGERKHKSICRECRNKKLKDAREERGLVFSFKPFPEGQKNISKILRTEIGPEYGYIKCSKCGIEKGCFEFFYRKESKVYRSECKECKSKYHKEHNAANREYFNALSREYNKNNKEVIAEYTKIKNRTTKGKWNNLTRAAKYKGLDVGITFEEYKEFADQPCYYCNDKMGDDVQAGYGLDRIDSDKGYIQGNVVRCCKYCNSIKNNFLTQEETKAAIQSILLIRTGG